MLAALLALPLALAAPDGQRLPFVPRQVLSASSRLPGSEGGSHPGRERAGWTGHAVDRSRLLLRQGTLLLTPGAGFGTDGAYVLLPAGGNGFRPGFGIARAEGGGFAIRPGDRAGNGSAFHLPAAEGSAPPHPPADGTETTAAPFALPPAPDPGRLSLAAAAGLPTHLLASVAVLAFACSGEVIGARCANTIEGSGGARAATWLLFATLPPLASGSVVWALGDDDEAPSSLPWIWLGGAAGQLLGFALAVATDSPAMGLLSLTAFPVAGEMAGMLLSRTPLPARPAALPLGTVSF